MSLSETTVSAKPVPPEGTGKISKTIGYCGAFVALGLAEAALGPTLPGLAENTQTDLGEISFLFIARSLGYLLGAFLGGRLYDRVPGHPVMATMVVTIGLMMILTPLTPLLWLLAAVLLLMGVAQSIVDVGGNTLLVWVHRHRVGPFMTGMHFFFGVGAFLAPIIVAQVILISGDITWAYWVLALLILPLAIWLVRLPSPVAQTSAQDSSTNRTNYGFVVLMAAFFFLFVGAEISFGGWIFSYMISLKLASEATAAYVTSAYWGALTIGRLVAIPAAVHFSPRSILLFDLGACLVSVGLILLWPGSLIAIWGGAFGVGFALAAVFPTAISLAERHLTVTGRITSWFIVGSSLGSMFLPWLIGQLFESVGPRVMMFAIFVDVVAALTVFVVLITYAARPTPSRLKTGV